VSSGPQTECYSARCNFFELCMVLIEFLAVWKTIPWSLMILVLPGTGGVAFLQDLVAQKNPIIASSVVMNVTNKLVQSLPPPLKCTCSNVTVRGWWIFVSWHGVNVLV
jgi:hypothetical protein